MMNQTEPSTTGKMELLQAVLRQAREDLQSGNDSQRQDAAQFFKSDWHKLIQATLLKDKHLPQRRVA